MGIETIIEVKNKTKIETKERVTSNTQSMKEQVASSDTNYTK